VSKKVLVSSKLNELNNFINSNAYKMVEGKIIEKVKNQRLATEGSTEIEKIFRAQGGIQMLKYVLTIPEKLRKEIEGQTP